MGSQELLQGKYYHIFSRSIDDTDLYTEPANYERFLSLYEKYILPVADTYAWVLMPNHFHILVKIRENISYKYSKDACKKLNLDFDEVKWQTSVIPELSGSENSFTKLSTGKSVFVKNYLSIPKPHLHFSHLLNAYSKYFNKLYQRHGSLFERPFKRKLINNQKYLKQLILYIHNNPINHGFCDHATGYPWSSYLSTISLNPTHLKRDVIIGWFDNKSNFKSMHENNNDVSEINKWLDLG